MQQARVEQADVVGCDDGALTGLGEIFEAFDLEPKQRSEEESADVFDALLAPSPQDQRDGA